MSTRNEAIEKSLIQIEEHAAERILVARLNRPAAANAIDAGMAVALEALASRVEGAKHIDALILTGNGRAFCSGGDVAVFRAQLVDESSTDALAVLLDQLATRVHGALLRLMNAGPLLIGAINGAVTGGGLGLVCICDLAYALPAATLRAGFSRLGLSPDSGTTWFLPRLLGHRGALEFLLSGEAMSAETAVARGVFREVLTVDETAFLPQVIERTHALIASGPAVRATRALLRSTREGSALAEQYQLEQRSLVEMSRQPAVLAHLRKVLLPP